MTLRTPETHAYHIPHVDVTNTQICKSVVAADNTFIKNDITAEEGSISVIDRKRDDANFDSSSDSRKIPLNVKNEVHLDNQRKAENYNRQQVIGNYEVTIRDLANVDHVYEEIRAIKQPRNSLYEHDIQDYYEKYSPATAKTLIDTLFLPRYTICKECARTKGSPVYTDRLIYMKKSLVAIEVVLCQYDDVSCFKYPHEDSEDIFCSQYNQNRDYMLVYNYTKTNVAGIFYFHCWPQDIFDLQSLLKPNIYVINRTCCNLTVNTHLYHRCINSYHVRTSRAGCTPMTFYHDYDTVISSTKYISHSENPPIYQVRRSKDHIDEYRRSRSSLLLLEPLLLIPESADSEQRENTKNKISQSECTKIIKIIIIYALSFLILTSITFYIVYFT